MTHDYKAAISDFELMVLDKVEDGYVDGYVVDGFLPELTVETIRSALQAMSDDNWVLVPREPNNNMCDEGSLTVENEITEDCCRDIFVAMIAAAPPADAELDEGAISDAVQAYIDYKPRLGYAFPDAKVTQWKHDRMKAAITTYLAHRARISKPQERTDDL
jgi:hypothetical protein